jgi:hypothetical protein
MHKRHHFPNLPAGQAVAGAAVVLGLVSAVGLLLAGDGPDLQALASSVQESCKVWPIPSAAAF